MKRLSKKFEINNHVFEMIHIPAGHFDMGDEHGDLISYSQPIKKNIHVNTFWMATYLTTQLLWQEVMDGENPSKFKGMDRPVERVSWDEVQVFLEKLNNSKEGLEQHREDGLKYILPSEVQWEYVARGGKNDGLKYAGSNNLKEVGWYDENSHNESKPVRKKLPNELGLYDMSGNVWEWCADDWVGNLESITDDQPRKADTKRRTVRGGAWYNNDNNCRTAFRFRFDSGDHDIDIGFRIARY